jgi:hypothetical protein
MLLLYAAGGVPCDVALKLPCGVEVTSISQILQMASPFFCGTLEDVKGSAPIPVSQMFSRGDLLLCVLAGMGHTVLWVQTHPTFIL